MGDKVLKIGTVYQCNCCLGSKTLHPLVSVIDLSKADLSPHTDIKFCLADPSTGEWSDMGENYTANAPGYSG